MSMSGSWVTLLCGIIVVLSMVGPGLILGKVGYFADVRSRADRYTKNCQNTLQPTVNSYPYIHSSVLFLFFLKK